MSHLCEEFGFQMRSEGTRINVAYVPEFRGAHVAKRPQLATAFFVSDELRTETAYCRHHDDLAIA